MDSILTSIKKLLGIDENYTHFDNDIIMHVNSVFMVLNQLGVGPTSGFLITSKDETWADFLGDSTKIEAVKTYTYLKVRLLFDPPTNSSTMDAMNRMIDELEWRLNTQAELSPSTNVTLPDIDDPEIDADILAMYNELKQSIEGIEKRLNDMGDGKDGVSPIVEFESNDDGHVMTVTDVCGSKTIEILNGKDGDDGISPTLSITPFDGGYTITVTDKEGSKSVNILHGENGTDGNDWLTSDALNKLLDKKVDVCELFGLIAFDTTTKDDKTWDVLQQRDSISGSVITKKFVKYLSDLVDDIELEDRLSNIEDSLDGLETLLGGI